MKIEELLKDQFAQDEIDEANGMRWLIVPTTETLWVSIKRRIRLLRSCVTFRPDMDYYDEIRPFRKEINTCRKVWPGDPDYDKADANFGKINRKCYRVSPWVGLIKKAEWPEGMGDTLE